MLFFNEDGSLIFKIDAYFDSTDNVCKEVQEALIVHNSSIIFESDSYYLDLAYRNHNSEGLTAYQLFNMRY